MHSGGAPGSDHYWDLIGKQYGVVAYHYYDASAPIEQKPPYANTPISDE
jgi:hypothetical protein